jgi:putative DNA-invertase from lambdoid prophage Rac
MPRLLSVKPRSPPGLTLRSATATAQSQAEVTKEAQKAGIAHAQANDDGTKYRGRKPTFTSEQFFRARELLNHGLGISAVAKTVGLASVLIHVAR